MNVSELTIAPISRELSHGPRPQRRPVDNNTARVAQAALGYQRTSHCKPVFDGCHSKRPWSPFLSLKLTVSPIPCPWMRVVLGFENTASQQIWKSSLCVARVGAFSDTFLVNLKNASGVFYFSNMLPHNFLEATTPGTASVPFLGSIIHRANGVRDELTRSRGA